jgi:sec-independent protein translocase protein TatA
MFENLFRPTHLLVVLGLALLIFGPKRLPQFGKMLGEGLHGIKKMIFSEGEAAVDEKTEAGRAESKVLRD